MKAWVCLAMVALLSEAPDARAAPDTGSPDATPQDSATRFVDLLAAGDFATAVKSFDDAMKQALPPDRLAGVWHGILAQAGRYQKRLGVRGGEDAGYRVAFVKCRFESATLEAKVVFDTAGRIAGLFFVPAQAAAEYSPPDYVKPGAFAEREVTVGPARWSLPGTLSRPARAGPFPGLVLVHGSGSLDRDESIGPNKPFRDLATGLASRGVAVLRYDKRTLAHAAETAALGDRLTLQEETVDDAVAAVALLRATPGIDGRRLFVLGHSLGGVAIPRVAALDPTIAGYILLATPSRPLEDLLVEQAEYLASVDGTVSEEERSHIEELRWQVARLKNPKPGGAADPKEPLLGASRAYWTDLRRGTGPQAVARLRQPLLVLQGGRDYQVTVEDFQIWKRTLASRTDVELKLYADLNHLLMPGSGTSTPAEYEVPGHVAPAVIDDLAAWIKRQPSAAPREAQR